MKLSFQLLSAAAFTPLASADFRQTFTFKDDFFVKFCGIDPGLGPDQSDGLLDGLNANVEEFQAAWRNKIDDLGCEPVVSTYLSSADNLSHAPSCFHLPNLTLCCAYLFLPSHVSGHPQPRVLHL